MNDEVNWYLHPVKGSHTEGSQNQYDNHKLLHQAFFWDIIGLIEPVNYFIIMHR